MILGAGLFEFEAEVFGTEGFEHVVDLTQHEAGQAVLGTADAMVGDAVLGKVVGTNFFGAVAGADLGQSGVAVGFLVFFLFDGEKTGAENVHGFELIFELGFFVLAGDDEAGGDVGDTDGRISGVDGLAAVAGTAINIDTEVGVVYGEIGFFGFGQDGDGDGGGVDAAAGFGFGDALDAVDAGFVFEPAVSAVAFDFEDDFLVAADVRGGFGDELDAPIGVGQFEETGVHAIELAGEQASLVTAGTGSDFDNGVFGVGRVLGYEGQAEAVVDGLKVGFESGDFVAGEVGHLGVVEEGARLG